MKYKIKYGSRFVKDLDKSKKQGKNLDKFKEVITILANGEKLDSKYKDHKLKGEYSGYRECHIEPDWLLIYRYEYDFLLLYRLGSHSDLFG